MSGTPGGVTAERAASPAFLRVHRLVAGAWAGAFGVLALADLVWMRRPDWPLAVPLAIGGAGLLAALAFTRWMTSRSVSKN